MRVAMISTPFIRIPPGTYGGTELVVHELVEGLVRNGHDVTLFATGDSCSSAELRWFFERAQWPPQPYTDLTHVGHAMREIGLEHFDVVHAHSAVAVAMALLLPVPLVYTLHHDRDAQLSALYAAHPSTFYVAISADQRRREVQLPYCEVIHHGLDPAAYRCAPRSSGYLCFVGRFSKVKGPHTAIDVAAASGLPIVMAGEVHEPDRAFAERELSWRLQQPHVEHLGTIGLNQKRPLLRDARALLAPIEWNEPFGLILIEAMLSGCPVVAFGRGSVPELIEEGVTGFVVQTREEMSAVVAAGGPLDRFDRYRCRKRAVERFSAPRMVHQYERVYELAIARAGIAADRPSTVAA